MKSRISLFTLLLFFKENTQNSCLHFWVMVLPPDRDVEEPTFVNPPNGKYFHLDESEEIFKSVHSIFNHEDFWACRKFDQTIDNLNVGIQQLGLYI